MFVTWRVAWPRPRTSISTSSGPISTGAGAVPARPLAGAWARATTLRPPAAHGRPEITAPEPGGM